MTRNRSNVFEANERCLVRKKRSVNILGFPIERRVLRMKRFGNHEMGFGVFIKSFWYVLIAVILI